MSNSNKTALLISVGISFSFLLSAGGFVEALPTAEDINSLAETARLTGDTFMQESFALRMRYEFSRQFSDPNDSPQDAPRRRDSLHRLAKTAGEHLQMIAEKQKTFKQQIEDYQGRDWDAKYGQSGLWRKLSADIYTTGLSKCEVDFYLALTAEQPQRNEILHRILAEINSLNRLSNTAYLQFLKARTLALLARTDPTYQPLAKKEFDKLMIRSDMNQSTAFRITIERTKLFGITEAERLKLLAEELAQSSCRNDPELVLSLMSLQRRYSPEDFEKTVQIFPETEYFLGLLILSDISNRITRQKDLEHISVFEAELAAQAVWRDETRGYDKLLDYFLSEAKFQTPLILYVSAVKFAESSPAKAVELLIEASKLQRTKKSDRLDVEPAKIAEQAAQLSYNLFAADLLHCRLAVGAFENYFAMAGEQSSEELEYLYCAVLDSCGKTEEAEKLLEKIANRPTGKWRNKAGLELIVRAIQQGRYENPTQRNKLLGQFSSLIADLASPERFAAASGGDCKYAGAATVLVGEVIDEIDEIQQQAELFDKVAEDCRVLAEFCFGCLDGEAKRQAGLYLAEASIFAANKEEEKLSAVEELLNDTAQSGNGDVDLLRCRARLLSEQGKFGEAAELWAKICEIRRGETSEADKRSWKWWRAKFYELYCLAECPQTRKAGIYHTIEVLENSFTDIAPVWAEKLNSLKHQCLR